VHAFLRDRIAGYKVPATVEFVDTPLRDDAGKARRSAVRAQVMARLLLIALLCIVVCAGHGAIASS
jgi:bile acid-coenzyme A ligase